MVAQTRANYIILYYIYTHPISIISQLQLYSQLVRSASSSMFCLCVVLATVLSHHVLWKRDKTTRVLESRWGFEGDFAAQNMMTAFGKARKSKHGQSSNATSTKCLIGLIAFIPASCWNGQLRQQVGHTPEVYSLSLEIDKLLRITSGHRFHRSSFENERHSVAPLQWVLLQQAACLPILRASCLQVALLMLATDAFE